MVMVRIFLLSDCLSYPVTLFMISVVSHTHFSDHFLGFLSLVNNHVAIKTNSSISQAGRDANKISMTKNIFGGGPIEQQLLQRKIVLRVIQLTFDLTKVCLSISPATLW